MEASALLSDGVEEDEAEAQATIATLIAENLPPVFLSEIYRKVAGK